MQRPSCAILICLCAAAAGGGCRRQPPPTPPTVTKPVVPPLVVACADPLAAAGFVGRAGGWAASQGRTAAVGPEDAADLIIVRPQEVGRLAVAGLAAPLPADLKAAGHPLQWSRILPGYRGLSTWAGETVAVPLAGDSLLVAYRADLFDDPAHQAGFQSKFNRSLLPPATWEELADVAAYFAEVTKKPSLPAAPADADRLLAEFHAIAACADRQALVDAELKGKEPPAGGFHTDPAGGHRLGTPGFRAAAEWLASVATFRGPEADPATALTTGTAAVAVVTLAEVGRLPKGPDGVADPRVRVLPPPGRRTFFPGGKPATAGGRGGNYVPFLGAGGWVAVVNPKRPDPSLAWGLLTELAGPAAASARVSDPGPGAGPVRAEIGSAGGWARYAFDPARNADLAAAVRQFLGVEVVNPAVTLRTPDAAERLRELAEAVRQAATGKATGEVAMRQAVAAWDRRDTATLPDELKRWRRNAAGLP